MIQKRFELIGLPERPPKPRKIGRTMMLDKGLSVRQVEDLNRCCRGLRRHREAGMGHIGNYAGA